MAEANINFKRFTKKNILIIAIITILYFSWIFMAVGFRTDQVGLVSVCIAAFYFNDTSRKLLFSFFPLILYWILYDSMRVYPNYLFNPVHIIEPYEIEKAWFGIQTATGVLTPNEYCVLNQQTILDILSGCFYVCWIPVPMLYAVYLFFTDRKTLIHFCIVFLVANIIGIIIYYLYPAAPPWYVAQFGFQEQFDIPGNTAGLARFDEYFNISLFAGIYEKNANVFAAIPSMHSAFPMILSYFAVKKKSIPFSIAFITLAIGIWSAAVYTEHHYIIDVLAGITCACTSIVIVSWFYKNAVLSKWIHAYEQLIE